MRILLLFLLLLLPLSVTAQVVITEIQPAPVGDEPEWVEIENTGSKAVTITDWQICDERSCTEIPTARLSAGQRAVLTRDVEALQAARSIPDDARLLEVSLPSLNNTTDAVALHNKQGALVDSLAYDLSDFSPPRSLERVGSVLDGAVAFDARWTPCIDRSGSTPGRRNSTLVLDDDLAIVNAEAGIDGLAVTVLNLGRTTAIDVPISYSIGERSRSTMIEILAPTSEERMVIPLAELGWPDIWGEVHVAIEITRSDDRRENDTLTMLTSTPPPTGTITLNEIMFDPWPEGTDYIEIANTGSDTVDLSGWIIEDERGDQGVIPPHTRIPPGGLLVAANDDDVRSMMDSGVPAVLTSSVNLNATGDLVILRSGDGYRVDQVTYSDDWHLEVLSETKGLALEKRAPELVSDSPASWTTSAHPLGGTPGSPNTASVDVDVTTELTVQPSPFSSDRRHPRHPAVIGFTQPFRHAIARMEVRSVQGALVRRILDAGLIGTEGGAVWDGRNDLGQRVRPGQYVVVLECVDAISSRVHHATAVVVVGE